jgi:hypothetical protein
MHLLPHMIAATNYLGLVDGEPIAHMAVSPRFEIEDAVRACRLVILTEWQGTGAGFSTQSAPRSYVTRIATAAGRAS